MINIKEILEVLPICIKNNLINENKIEQLQEIRLRVNKPLIFQIAQKNY